MQVFHSGGIKNRIMIARKQEYNDTKNHHDGCETQMKRIGGEDAGDWNEERSSPAGHHKLTCPKSKNRWQPVASEQLEQCQQTKKVTHQLSGVVHISAIDMNICA